jgi:hypothetical protein
MGEKPPKRTRRTAWLARVVALAGFPLAPEARAIELFVDSALDQIDDDVSDGVCHTAAGTCTLRAAVMTANRITGNVRVDILLPAGTFELTRPAVGANGDDGGDLNLTDAPTGNPLIVVDGAGPGVTIVDGGETDRVFRVHAGARVEMFDLTVRNGFADPIVSDGGGCIRNYGALRIESATISECVGPHGGGILSAGPGANLQLRSTSFSSCVATGDGGAALISGSGIVARSSFAFNSAGRGGALYAAAGIFLLVEDSEFAFNGAEEGGALATAGTLFLSRSRVELNGATRGGGAHVEPGGVLALEESAIRDNAASAAGGGVHVAGHLQSDRSAIWSNSAETGGGVDFASSGSLVMFDSTVSANSAATFGGGFYLHGSPGLNVYSSTIAFNAADADQDGSGDAGGIYNEDGVANLRNSLVAGNYVFDSQSNPDDCAGEIGSFGRNLFGDTAGCTIVTGSGSWGLLDDLGLLGSLAFHGGRTPTHPLLPGSNAIDGGDPAEGCLGPVGLLTVDQRGAPRVAGARCDVGAFERGSLIFDDAFEWRDTGAWSLSAGE